MSVAAVEAVDRVVNRGGANDTVLRAVVAALVERGGCTWARIIMETGSPVAEAGTRGSGTPARVAVKLGGRRVAELEAEGCDDEQQLARVAVLASPYCRPATAA